MARDFTLVNHPMQNATGNAPCRKKGRRGKKRERGLSLGSGMGESRSRMHLTLVEAKGEMAG